MSKTKTVSTDDVLEIYFKEFQRLYDESKEASDWIEIQYDMTKLQGMLNLIWKCRFISTTQWLEEDEHINDTFGGLITKSMEKELDSRKEEQNEIY